MARGQLSSRTATGVHLPPDWATVGADGSGPRPRAAPTGESARYGYDATRVLAQLAVDCRVADQQVAASA